MLIGRMEKTTLAQIKEEIDGSYDDVNELEKLRFITSRIEDVGTEKVNFLILKENRKKVMHKLKEIEDILKVVNGK
ncbi:MAG: hypothetical protein QXU18_10915 [Thermoplasmatales archaeon]